LIAFQVSGQRLVIDALAVSDFDLGIQEGAELVVDGRDFNLQGFENGFFMGDVCSIASHPT
jgi:hypothetical protein